MQCLETRTQLISWHGVLGDPRWYWLSGQYMVKIWWLGLSPAISRRTIVEVQRPKAAARCRKKGNFRQTLTDTYG